MPGPSPTLDCPCGEAYLTKAFEYDKPPEGEITFGRIENYSRCYQRCRLCGHWFADHDIDIEGLYSGEYVRSTYGDKLRAAYDKIMALPPESSDNVLRVGRLLEFARDYLPELARPPRVLDVGAGLAVFPARMREAGWLCVAVDPDPIASKHARDVAGVETVMGDFRDLDHATLGHFELVTFNKVLEHVEAPVDMLSSALPLLEPHGFAYVEVPDASAAALGPSRNEFSLAHHHVFSPMSLCLLMERAGFHLLRLQRICEPSGKYTLFALGAPAGESP